MILSSRSEIASIPLRELLELGPERFAQVFRGTAVKRLKLTGLLRNACVAAGNSASRQDGGRDLVPALLGLAGHESALVRAHAVWAVRKLAGDEALALLSGARERETDQAVLEEFVAPLA